MSGTHKRLMAGWDRLDLETLDKAWTSWDQIYRDKVKSVADALDGCDVVGDLCTGFGYLSKELVERGKTVYGIDISKDALEYAGKTVGKNKRGKFIPVQSSIYQLPNGLIFDGISCLSNLGQHDIHNVTNEILKVLKPSGIVALTNENPEQRKRYVEHLTREGAKREFEFTREEAERLIEIREGISRVRSYGTSSELIIDAFSDKGMQVLNHYTICHGFSDLIVAKKI